MFGLGLGIGLGQNVAALGGGGGGGGFTVPSGTKIWVETDATHLYTDAGTILVSATGQSVQQANDQSGGSNHAGSSTAGERPTYQIVSGKPCLRFDGSNDRIFSGPGIALLDGTGQFWIAISCTLANLTAANQYLIEIFQSGGSFLEIGWLRAQSSGASVLTSFDNTTSGSDDNGATLSATTPVVLLGQVSSGTLELWVNNASGGSSALSGTRQTGAAYVVVGADSGNANNATMDVFGWGAGTGVLGSTDRTSVYTRLAGLHP
jgi:hypothetical protein